MNYIENLDNSSINMDFVKQIQVEVDDYFTNFKDSPNNTSRWAHHYFCGEEGGRFIYNDKTPHSHICSVCGKESKSELFDGCWITMYRNQGATNTWKSALLYNITKDKKYLKNLITFVDFYNDNYLNFKLHNKEGLEFDNLETAMWGCSRIMPQALNEAIFIIRVINALEIVKESLPIGYLKKLESGIFSEAFIMFKPQVDKIHNIPTWLNSAIGVMGHFIDNKEMLDFVYNGDFNISNQLTKGVTGDSFWYEGSIHYNYFLLEGVVNLLLFAELNNYDFNIGKQIVEKMLIAGYNYAFETHLLPNPNDGWPDVNLKTYSYIYATAAKIFGEDSKIGKILGSILNLPNKRGILPLSKPYYYNNDISLEEFIFVPKLREKHTDIIKTESVNFKSSYCGVLKAFESNIFLKYGHNGPSHAHPDKMNIEVLLKGEVLSRDLSNSGYGNPLCNEWHRVSASHNTVVVNGENHTGFGGGDTLFESKTRFKAESKNVYEGVTFIRDVELLRDGFVDHFNVTTPINSVCDYFFHPEVELLSELKLEDYSFSNVTNGYQHLKNVKRVITNEKNITIDWFLEGYKISSQIDLNNTELFICQSPDNSEKGYRNTIILRQNSNNANFKVIWKI